MKRRLVSCQLLALYLFPTSTVASQCLNFPADARAKEVREALKQNRPLTAAFHELQKYRDNARHWEDLLPGHSPLNIAVSDSRGFYNSFLDPKSEIGLSRIWPYMIEEAPWGALLEIMEFQVQRSRGQAGSIPDLPPELSKLLQDPSNTWYVNGQSNDDLWQSITSGELVQVLKRLTAIQKPNTATFEKELPRLNLWLSAGATISNLHFDPSDNWMCQLSGKKTFIMFHPNDTEKLYPVQYGIEGGGGDYNSVLDESTGTLVKQVIDDAEGDGKAYSAVNLQEPDLTRFPLFADATPVTCSIGPGQCIWIPQLWWHNVAAQESEINLSLNLWYRVAAEEQLQFRGFDLKDHFQRMIQSFQRSTDHLKHLQLREDL